MISKNTFIKTIKFIQTKRRHEDALCKALELCYPHDYVNALIYTDYEDLTIDLLREAMEIDQKDDTLEYWIYELDFGKNYKPGCFIVNEKNVDISTVGKLYEYLIKETKK